MSGLDLREAALDDVPPRTLHDLLRLRVDVFVVEQECAYPEIDGRDGEPGALLLWAQDAAGRVATAAEFRGAGVAARLVRRALELAGEGPVVLDAQAHLAHWYARFGFAATGEPFTEDGIPHVPMRRG